MASALAAGPRAQPRLDETATVRVKIPPGGKPGKAIRVQGPDGTQHSMSIPPGKKAGDTWDVQVPVE